MANTVSLELPKKLLTVKMVAEVLGKHPMTIHKWQKAGMLPSIRIGSRIMFDEAQIVEWINRRRSAA